MVGTTRVKCVCTYVSKEQRSVVSYKPWTSVHTLWARRGKTKEEEEARTISIDIAIHSRLEWFFFPLCALWTEMINGKLVCPVCTKPNTVTVSRCTSCSFPLRYHSLSFSSLFLFLSLSLSHTHTHTTHTHNPNTTTITIIMNLHI